MFDLKLKVNDFFYFNTFFLILLSKIELFRFLMHAFYNEIKGLGLLNL